jgi:hypothetical protein
MPSANSVIQRQNELLNELRVETHMRAMEEILALLQAKHSIERAGRLLNNLIG